MSLAFYFGGPDDGATRELSPEDVARGTVESIDAAGNAFTYAIVELPEPRTFTVGPALYRLEPQEVKA